MATQATATPNNKAAVRTTTQTDTKTRAPIRGGKPAAKAGKPGAGKRAVDAARTRSEQLKLIDTTVSRLEKAFGEGSIMRLGQQPLAKILVVPTGSRALDKALGVGGLPRGRMVEVFGPEASGKTTLALHCIANAQRSGGIAALIDAEHAFDPSYARKIGVDLDALIVSQPDSGEQALRIAEELINTGAIDIVAVDSVAALVPQAELNGEIGDTHVGLQARLMSQALRKLTGSVHRSNTCLVFINQLREKIGVMFGSPETTPGGRALKFYASVRLDIRRIGQIKDGDRVIGNRTRVTVAKNKVAPPFGKCEFEILFDRGIDAIGELLELGAQFGVIEKTGSWYSYEGARLGQGRMRASEFVMEPANRTTLGSMEQALTARLFPVPEAPSEDGAADGPASNGGSASAAGTAETSATDAHRKGADTAAA